MTNKERFISIVKENIKRDGIDALMDWLETTDFYTAPASSRYHCACPEGLLMHLMRKTDSFEKTLMLGKNEGKRRRGQQKMR